MRAVSVKPTRQFPDGTREVDAFIIADDAPAILPTTGAGIVGLTATDVFAPFSILYVVNEADNKVFIANESGRFVAQ